tara:strand:+ start:1066 stop:3432 length:2367 start_codon:yes stop_codon:yes gene_type:complete
MSNFKDTDNYDESLALKQEGLTKKDFNEICKRLKRKPNRTELGMFGVMWSEHCCYRNSKSLLIQFPTKGPRILVGPGENAGVIDVGFGYRLVFKIESHNHPSAIEPFQGAATGVGGILRDIFTMGARPIAVLNSLRFGPLEDENNISLLKGVVSGISHYGNCVGVPTVGGEVSFDDSYSKNPLVNVMAIGLMETEEIVCSGARGINYPVLYVGNTTGKDGVGGASFASAELTSSSLDDRPAVQVGDPFLEKSLIEACLEVFKTGNIVAAQDMGAAGLTCSSSEMAANGNVGVFLDLNLVPAREKNMEAYHFLLSESQERMLLVVKPDKLKNTIQIFEDWGLSANVVGKIIDEKKVIVSYKEKIVADIPTSALADDTPVNTHDLLLEPPLDIRNHWKWNPDSLPQATLSGIQSLFDNKSYSWKKILLKLLANPNLASKNWIYDQYDYQVQLNTVIQPGKADAAVIRLRSQVEENDSNTKFPGIAASVDCNNRWVSLDPERGAIAAVVESARNVVCVGAKPVAITNNLNFSSPNTDEGYWQLAKACSGISKACSFLNTPVTGGNVSLFNESVDDSGITKPIHPTPVIGMIGILDDYKTAIGSSWSQLNDEIWLIGSSDDEGSLSASSYLDYFHGLRTGRPPFIDLELETNIQNFVIDAITKGILASAHDVGDGGLTVALAESCISSGLGVFIDLKRSNERIDKILFSEGGSRILLSVNSHNKKDWIQFINDYSYKFNKLPKVIKIGFVDNDTLSINNLDVNLLTVSVSQLQSIYNNSIAKKILKLEEKDQ